MNLTTIADQGNTLEMLKALRHKLAETLDASKSGRDIAALARQLQIVSAQISDLEAMQSNDPIAEILSERGFQIVRDKNGHPIYPTQEDDNDVYTL